MDLPDDTDAILDRHLEAAGVRGRDLPHYREQAKTAMICRADHYGRPSVTIATGFGLGGASVTETDGAGVALWLRYVARPPDGKKLPSEGVDQGPTYSLADLGAALMGPRR